MDVFFHRHVKRVCSVRAAVDLSVQTVQLGETAIRLGLSRAVGTGD